MTKRSEGDVGRRAWIKGAAIVSLNLRCASRTPIEGGIGKSSVNATSRWAIQSGRVPGPMGQFMKSDLAPRLGIAVGVGKTVRLRSCCRGKH
jgi:hypothetical protein